MASGLSWVGGRRRWPAGLNVTSSAPRVVVRAVLTAGALVADRRVHRRLRRRRATWRRQRRPAASAPCQTARAAQTRAARAGIVAVVAAQDPSLGRIQPGSRCPADATPAPTTPASSTSPEVDAAIRRQPSPIRQVARTQPANWPVQRPAGRQPRHTSPASAGQPPPSPHTTTNRSPSPVPAAAPPRCPGDQHRTSGAHVGAGSDSGTGGASANARTAASRAASSRALRPG